MKEVLVTYTPQRFLTGTELGKIVAEADIKNVVLEDQAAQSIAHYLATKHKLPNTLLNQVSHGGLIPMPLLVDQLLELMHAESSVMSYDTIMLRNLLKWATERAIDLPISTPVR